MHLIPSRYNFIYPLEADGVVLFNARTGAALAADGPTAQAVLLCLHQPRHQAPPGSNLARVKTKLAGEGFLVHADLDELAEVRSRRHTGQRRIDGLGLTIAVTLACNFRCGYCYQDHPVEHMGRDAARSVLSFASDHLPARTSLHVTWFGGEPLLNVDAIEFLSDGLRRMCEERGCSYDCLMVTNGYRLNLAMARRLAKSGIRDYQISIDGEREYHDRQRPLAGGQGTFDVLMRNLSAVAPEVTSIAVRVNLLRANVESASRLVRRLKQMEADTPALSISLGHVDSSSEHCGTDRAALLNGHEFAEHRSALLDFEDDGLLPAPIDTVCCADRLNCYVIAPNGDLFKCWNSLGRPHDCIGRIAGEVGEATCSYLQFQADDDAECRDCKFLPLCHGGCPDVQMRTARAEKECTELKYTLGQRLAAWAKRPQTR